MITRNHAQKPIRVTNEICPEEFGILVMFVLVLFGQLLLAVQ